MPKGTKQRKTSKKAGTLVPTSETDLRHYTWGIIYLSRDRRFQCHALQSDGHRSQGLLEVLGEKDIQLTQVRRTEPFMIQFSESSKSQRVYLFATIANSKYPIKFHGFEMTSCMIIPCCLYYRCLTCQGLGHSRSPQSGSSCS